METMNWKRILIALGSLVGLLLVVTLGKAALDSRPKPPSPTPTLVPIATYTPKPPPTEFTCAGGDIFFIMNPEYVLETYNIEVKIEKISTFDVKTSDKLPELDCFFPGSYTAFEDFAQAHPDKVLASATLFRTFGVFMTRSDLFLPWLLKYEIVYENNGKYSMPMGVLIAAMKNNWNWSELFQSQAEKLGITYDGDPKVDKWLELKVNVYYGAPEYSSGAMQHVLFLANCTSSPNYDCSQIATLRDLGSVSNLNSVINFLVENWDAQPLQIKRSPDWFDTYRAKSGSYPLAASSESLFIGWYNGLSDEKKETSGQLIVGIYPEYTISTDHVLIALKPEARVLIDIFQNDKYLQQLAWDRYGMRTAVGDVGTIPGGTNIPWLLADPLSLFEPKYDVYQEVTKYIHK